MLEFGMFVCVLVGMLWFVLRGARRPRSVADIFEDAARASRNTTPPPEAAAPRARMSWTGEPHPTPSRPLPTPSLNAEHQRRTAAGSAARPVRFDRAVHLSPDEILSALMVTALLTWVVLLTIL